MSCYKKEELQNMLEDVVNELCLSDIAIENHGQLGTPPSDLLRLVLCEKNKRMNRMNAKLANIKYYANQIRHNNRAESLEAQGFSEVECAEIATEDSIAYKLLGIIGE